MLGKLIIFILPYKQLEKLILILQIPVSGDLLSKYQNSYGRKSDNIDGCSENGSDLCLSKEEIRAKIVEEIVSTERDYVQNLKDIVEVHFTYSIIHLKE